MSDTPTVKALTEHEIKKNIPTTGWERVKKIYDGISEGKLSFELDVLCKVSKGSFFTAFFLGGLTGFEGVFDRFNLHEKGKTYISPRDAVKRKIDFSIAMFAKRGFIHGLRALALSGSVIFVSTHLIAYNDNFSYLYFPLVSGATTGFLHRGAVFGVLAFPIGILGTLKAVGLGLTTGSSLSAFLFLYGLSSNKSSNDIYKQFKCEYEEMLKIKNDEEMKVRQFMKDEGIYFRPMAIKKMMEVEKEKMLREISLNDD